MMGIEILSIPPITYALQYPQKKQKPRFLLHHLQPQPKQTNNQCCAKPALSTHKSSKRNCAGIKPCSAALK